MEERSTQLETEFVFLDTEVLVREKFDWRSKSFTRLKALVATRHIKLLTTSVTIREVKAKMRETLANASGAVKKYEILLAQLGAPECSTLVSEASAIEKLEALFEAFLQDINVIEVPLEIDIAHIFDDYFGQQPPFSDKKKSEFPDAVVIHSLRNWCKQRLFRTYVVSGDPDIKACCDDILLHVESLSEIVSKATVTARVQSHLLEFVRDNRWLRPDPAQALHHPARASAHRAVPGRQDPAQSQRE